MAALEGFLEVLAYFMATADSADFMAMDMAALVCFTAGSSALYLARNLDLGFSWLSGFMAITFSLLYCFNLSLLIGIGMAADFTVLSGTFPPVFKSKVIGTGFLAVRAWRESIRISYSVLYLSNTFRC